MAEKAVKEKQDRLSGHSLTRRKACGSIHDGDIIMIDGGSTTFHMVEHLARFAITVITNSFAIAQHLVTSFTVHGDLFRRGPSTRSSKLILNNLSADAFANYHASTPRSWASRGSRKPC